MKFFVFINGMDNVLIPALLYGFTFKFVEGGQN